jgi:hypothetical protein
VVPYELTLNEFRDSYNDSDWNTHCRAHWYATFNVLCAARRSPLMKVKAERA